MKALVRSSLIKAGLTRDECRLVSGFRGLSGNDQSAILETLAAIVVDRARGLSGLVSYATDVPPYHWKCDDPKLGGTR